MNISDEELKSLLPGKIKLSRAHYISGCPFCGKDRHFYINRHTQLFDCKRCLEVGNIYKLLAFLGKLFLLGDFKSIDRKKVTSLVKKKELTEEETKELIAKKKPLPAGFKRLYSDDYLKGRGLTEIDFIKYKIGYTTFLSDLKDYVIFSIEEDKISRGYIGRYSGKDKDKRRYNNSKNTNFSKLLFGYDEITPNTSTVIITEGIFDKISLDNYLDLNSREEIKAISTFGKKISSIQIQKLKLKGVSTVILIYDYDAIKEMKKFGLVLKENFDSVFIGYTTNKDINDSEKEEVLEIFNNLKTVEQFYKRTVSLL